MNKIFEKFGNFFELVKTYFYLFIESKFFYNILLSFLCIFAFFTPDYILKFTGQSHVMLDFAFIFAFFVFGLVLSMIKNKKVVFFIVGFFFVLEAIQLHYMGYFGTPISPLEIKKIFTETHDIAQSGFTYFWVVWYILPSMILSYGIYLYFYNKYSNECFKTKISYIILIIILSVKPIRAYRKTIKHFLPSPIRNSIHNTLNTFSYFFVKELWISEADLKLNFKEYKIEKIENFDKPDIVIFLVLESANYRNLGLYGYERDTTPNLSKLKNNKNFIYKKGISSSVSTASALPFLFNVVREPGNTKLLSNSQNSLIKLAKDNGYTTYFATSQDSKNLNNIGTKFLDKIITREQDAINFKINKDDALLDYLDQFLNDNKKNKFISIFQRNLHSPYENNYENHKEFDVYKSTINDRKTLMTNNYDNAVLYEDFFINEVIKKINNIKDKSVILIITSDHGQMLGEDGLYGHNILDYRVAEVPFMIYHNDLYKNIFSNKIKEIMPHYDISSFIANIIGYNIENSNDDGTRFIQGTEIYLDNIIIPYKQKENNNIEFMKKNSILNHFNL